ncbi:hypothetical protein F8M41_015285 [Gigaspora margarita]|uniref:GH18 domain-containing protein n=1 Tax=Gigaspora margarita TaxID=4874 RepID=A0A8H3WUA9_GIGMA|nr:hypothetical protein F8M41_015285 [Gigaspora margarita]
MNYKHKYKLKFQIILSVQLPTDRKNLIQFFNESELGGAQLITDLVLLINMASMELHGIDIDYPFKLPCYPSLGFDFTSAYSSFLNGLSSRLGNEILMITTGQYPINITNFNNISVDFINIQAFNLNVNSTITSAGIDKIQLILNSWSSVIDKSKLILAVEFGGIIEIVSSNNIKSDIENQHIQIANASNSMFPMANEPIPDQCQYSSNAKQSYLYQQNSSSTNYFVVFYEDYQSLNAKLSYINNNGLAGISIADINKDSNDSQLINFIASEVQPAPSPGGPYATQTSTSSSTFSSSNNTGAIVGGVIGSFIVVSIIASIDFMLYRKCKVEMLDLLKDTKNQTCSDINRQDYSNINRQVRSDTHNRIYSDTNHQVS